MDLEWPAATDQEADPNPESADDEDEHPVIRAHRLVLCACSPYFDKMLAGSGNFKERNRDTLRLHGLQAK